MDDERLRAVLSFFYDTPLNNEEFMERWESLPFSREDKRLEMCYLLLQIQEQLNTGPNCVKILKFLEEIERLGILQGGRLAALRSVYGCAAVDVAVRALGSKAEDVGSYIEILDRCFMVLRCESSELGSVEMWRWEKILKDCLWANAVIGWNQLQVMNLEAKPLDKLRGFLDSSFDKLRNWFIMDSAALWNSDDEKEEGRGPKIIPYPYAINQFSKLPLNSFRDWFLSHIQRQDQDQRSVLSLLSNLFEYLENVRQKSEKLKEFDAKLVATEAKWTEAVIIARNTLPKRIEIEVSSLFDFQFALAIVSKLEENFVATGENFVAMRLMPALSEARADELFNKAKNLGVDITCHPDLGQVINGLFVSLSALNSGEAP